MDKMSRAAEITDEKKISRSNNNKYMESAVFNTPEELRDFYKTQGYFGIYLSAFQGVEDRKVVEHFGLLKSGQEIPFEGFIPIVYDLNDKFILEILREFLSTDLVIIHPTQFQIKPPHYGSEL